MRRPSPGLAPGWWAVVFLLIGVLDFTTAQAAPLAGIFGHWVVSGPLMPWLLIPAGFMLGGFLLLSLLTILDG